MSDGIAPAIDKVGAPAPGAPEAQAGAPTMDTVTPVVAPPPAEEPAKTEEQKIEEGAGPAPAPPKPVEVMSVPETPINNRTPAGGTPRPELKLDEEPKPAPSETNNVVIEPVNGAAVPPPEKETNGATEDVEMTSGSGAAKRKLEEEKPAVAETSNGSSATDSDARSEKKAKVDEASSGKPATNGKVGRPKKKDRPAQPGKTARKTRSQGPVEV